MAITADKLLDRPSELHRRYGGRLAMQKSLQEKMVGGGPANVVLTKKSIKNIEVIKVKVIQIENILKGTVTAEKKALDEKKRKDSSQRREKQEEKLETKPNIEKGNIKMPTAPKMGILDWIKNFIGNVLLGYFAVRLIKHLPKIMPIVKFLGNAADFIIDVGGKLLNGLATFIDWGYKAYDATRGFVKNLGGENFAKGFDKFIGVVDTALFLTSVLAADLALEAATGGGDGGGPGGGRGAGRVKTTSSAVARRYAQRFGRDAAVNRFGQEGVRSLGGKYARSGAENLARKGLVSLAGKGGAKAILGTVRPLLKRLPIIGALIDFGLSVALGESPGRAAFKAIGAGLLGSVGAAIGSVVPIAGNIVGGIVGGMAGDAIGGALYDMFFGNKKPQQKNQPVQKKAGGGITRGGKRQTGARRTLTKGKYKRVLKKIPKQPSKVEVKDKDKSVKETTEQLDKTKYFGPILAVSSKIIAKEEPTQKDYENVGLGLNLLISKGIEEKQLKGGLIAAFAEGGMVDSDFLEAAEKGADVSSWISATFKSEFETNAQRTLRLIKEKKGKAGVPGTTPPGPESVINIQGGDADFWTLVAVASREDGEPQAWADVAQSIYNRLASGAYSGKTIKDLILGQMQYEPTWKFPRPGVTGKPNQEWYAIKDAASAGMAAGQSEGAMKKVAAAILDPTLQKNAREFIQGRTDFRGYSVSGGVQRKPGDNYYGWYNNYRANKIGSVPNFGATATSTPGGIGPGSVGPLGTGKASSVDQFNEIAKKYGLSLTSSYRAGDSGYHGRNRARDYSNDAVGNGTPEQLAFAKYLVQNYGSSLTQLIYTPLGFGIANGKKVGLDYWGPSTNAIHYHHVHVALAKGGRIKKPIIALIGEKGPEFVFDADTTAGLDRLAPGILEKLNVAKTKPQLASILQSYTSYEQPYAEPEIQYVEVPVPMPAGDGYESSSGGTTVIATGGDDPFDTLYQGG